MEGILGYIRLVLKKNYLVNCEDFYLIYFSKFKKNPPARLFHPTRLLDSGEQPIPRKAFLVLFYSTNYDYFFFFYSSNGQTGIGCAHSGNW